MSTLISDVLLIGCVGAFVIGIVMSAGGLAGWISLWMFRAGARPIEFASY